MNNEEREKLIEEISTKLLYEIIFTEKKNFNTREYKDSELIAKIKSIIEREVKKNDIQENHTNEF